MIVNAFGKGGGSYLEPGDHLVHIFEVNDNDRTSKPAVDIVFKDDAGCTVKDTFFMTEAALWRIANLAIACGFAKSANDPMLRKLDTKDLQGRPVMIRVAKETSERDGKQYSVVKNFWSPKVDAPAAKIETDAGRDDEGFEAYDRNEADPF
jgi:hypothetical protein